MKDTTRPPRDGLVRARPGALELRSDGGEAMPTLSGHMAVFDEWTEINSLFEGNFLERIAPGSFKKTIREQRDDVKILFQHGHDPSVGDKPLGPIADLREDDTGVYYEVPMLDTSYNRDLLPGLEAGLYGSSFRFRVLREEIVDEPDASDHNPHGLPERTVKELQLYEGGPVTFPAYAGATAGARSMTDEMLVERSVDDPKLAERVERLVAYAQGSHVEEDPERSEEDDSPAESAPADDVETESHLEPERRAPQTTEDDFWSGLDPANKGAW